MSQHHLTVRDTTGLTIQLTAGWDNSMLKRFFLVLRDERRPAPDTGQALTPAQAKMLYYDSDETRYGLPHIGDVESRLERLRIPFSEEHVNAFGPDGKLVTNPKLLPLLCEILNEQIGDLPSNRVKYWDAEIITPASQELLDKIGEIKEWDRQYVHRYQLADPHPKYDPFNYVRWLGEQDDIMPYENWVRQQLVEKARVELLSAL